MTALALYCKSYRTDMKRVIRLAASVEKFNRDALPFYISVPEEDLNLFKAHLTRQNTTIISDESIISSSPRISTDQIKAMPGRLSQQVIKSEFWRLGASTSYLCLDSDAFFIRPFYKKDFISEEGVPYTMLDEARDLLEAALKTKKTRIVKAFQQESDLLQSIFNRTGRRYSFGPFPLVWHHSVWQKLDENYLKPNNMNLADAITLAPIESRWYGEALLAYKPIPLLPCQALFKVYHYAWQLDSEKLTVPQLAELYCGVIYQSAWEREMDWPQEGGNKLSKIGRRARRLLGRI